MNDALITLTGTVTKDPHYTTTKSGVTLLSVRIAATPRRFDRASGQWRDGETMFVTVTCWRGLADNASSSLARGDAIVVTGRMKIRTYERNGEQRQSIEIDATTVGHDLSRGVSRFQRARRAGTQTEEDRQLAEQLADAWEGEGSGGGTRDNGAGDGAADDVGAGGDGADGTGTWPAVDGGSNGDGAADGGSLARDEAVDGDRLDGGVGSGGTAERDLPLTATPYA